MISSDTAAKITGTKAKFVILDGAFSGLEIPLQFNPPGYSVEEQHEYSEKKLMGLKGVVHQFTGSKKSDLNLELLFDATDTGGDVRILLEPLKKIFEIDNTLHAPPPCRFEWGGFAFDGIVSNQKKEFTFFYYDGVPGRVKLTVALKPYAKASEAIMMLDLQSSDITKQRVVGEGDTIFALAQREYNTPAAWRLIAEANGIDDPLAIPPGTSLRLPSKDKDA